MTEDDLGLARMDDDGYGCTVPTPSWLLRDERDEAHARSLGKTTPADRWVGQAELREIDAAMRERGERPWNGCLQHYLRERYGDRLFHVMNGGWFVRPEHDPARRWPGGVLDITGTTDEHADYEP